MIFASREEVERRRKIFPCGTEIECVSMNDSNPIPSGTRGKVTRVDDSGTIHVDWYNGRSLGLIPEEDNFKIVKKA